MIIQMKLDATKKQYEKITKDFRNKGYQIKDVSSNTIFVFGLIGDTKSLTENDIFVYEGVAKVTRIQTPFKKASRSLSKKDTVIKIGSDVKIGGGNFQIIAGPCSVESEDQFRIIAKTIKDAGGKIIRGGSYKPRTSPYSFQGLEKKGLEIMRNISNEFGLKIVSEIPSSDKLEEFERLVDMIQVGARNMQNFYLLKELGKSKKPIILKRGLSSTIEEWLLAAEYIIHHGNPNVILCERGIRTFENYTRNTLDLSAVLAVKELSHLPIIVDPSHASGKNWMVEKLSLAAVSVGSDGVMIEIHNDPETALSDGAQSLNLEQYIKTENKISKFREMLNLKPWQYS